MELTGTIIAVLPAQQGVSARTGNQWMKQDYVIEVPGQYPKKCVFNIFGEDRIRQLNIQSGEQNVTIQFDIDAHEYNGRWFNDVRCYNVIRAGQQSPTQQAAPPAQQPNLFDSQTQQTATASEASASDNPNDDLPF